jgi:hypothetical protein
MTNSMSEEALMALPIPPSPWLVRGSAVVIIGRLNRARARQLVAGPRGLLAAPGLGSVCVLGLIQYDETPVGPYSELALIPGLFWRQLPGMLVSHMLVDSARSRMGGRALWGLPKELARFTWGTQRVSVATPEETPLVTLSWTTRPRQTSLFIPPAPVTTLLGPRHMIFEMHGRADGAQRARVTLDIPAASPYAPLSTLTHGPYLAWHLAHFRVRISHAYDLL